MSDAEMQVMTAINAVKNLFLMVIELLFFFVTVMASGIMLGRRYPEVFLVAFGKIRMRVEPYLIHHLRYAQVCIGKVLRSSLQPYVADELMQRLTGKHLYLPVYLLIRILDVRTELLHSELRVCHVIFHYLY